MPLRRRPTLIPSVLPPHLQSGAVGYVRITCFQETTLQELNDRLPSFPQTQEIVFYCA